MTAEKETGNREQETEGEDSSFILHPSSLLLDGMATARTLRAEIAAQVSELKAKGVTPHLAAVLIGADPASETYVAMKQKACKWVGMDSSIHRLPDTATQAEAEDLVERLNNDPAISGILVQHPLPKHLHEPAVLDQRFAPQRY